jgi:hypothetical protein
MGIMGSSSAPLVRKGGGFHLLREDDIDIDFVWSEIDQYQIPLRRHALYQPHRDARNQDVRLWKPGMQESWR